MQEGRPKEQHRELGNQLRDTIDHNIYTSTSAQQGKNEVIQAISNQSIARNREDVARSGTSP
jgi:hypothetical protein